MIRESYDCTKVNNPKTIAGIEWKVVVGVSVFFGFATLMYRAPYLLVIPLIILAFLRGPGRKDPMFLRVYLRHRAQRDTYSPAYITQPNQRFPRPNGFGRYNWF